MSDSKFSPFYNVEGEFHYGIVVQVNYVGDELGSNLNLTIQGCMGHKVIRLKGLMPHLLNTVGVPLIMVQKNVESESEDNEWVLGTESLVFRKVKTTDKAEYLDVLKSD